MFNARSFACLVQTTPRAAGIRGCPAETERYDFVYPPGRIRASLEEKTAGWAGRKNLMVRAGDRGLVLEQVVGLRLVNQGKDPAVNVRLLLKQQAFESLTTPYLGQDTDDPAWREVTLKIPDLSGSENAGKLTGEIIPLAHMSQNLIDGEASIPIELIWQDGGAGADKADQNVPIDVNADKVLVADLRSAEIGSDRDIVSR